MGHSWTIRMRERRAEAQARGFCVACCKQPVVNGKSVCSGCNASAKARVARMRLRRRDERLIASRAHKYESEGNAFIGRSRSNWNKAVECFQRALKFCASVEDERRLCGKIGHALSQGSRPELATPWLEQVEQNILLPRQRWFESRTQDAIAEYDKMQDFFASATNGNDTNRAFNCDSDDVAFYQAKFCMVLGRYEEAERLLAGLEPARSFPVYQWIFHAVKARKEAFKNFDRDSGSLSLLRGAGLAPGGWDDYANWATELGRLDIARTCRERALLVARKHRLAWHIPYCSLRLAAFLIVVGEYDDARHFLSEAMTHETESPFLHVMKATIGVELAHAVGDATLLKRTFDESVVDAAIASGEPQRIAASVVAYAKVAISRRQIQHARRLIARGVTATRSAALTGELLAMTARYATAAEAARARELLETQAQSPHHYAAQAYLELWHAQAALSYRSAADAKIRAGNAARLFAKVGWKHQEREALGLVGILPKKLAAKSAEPKTPILGNLQSTLTEREQQIAELALRGLKNHAIAELLSISEHTVESHMRSILTRLGLRSRWQLSQYTM